MTALRDNAAPTGGKAPGLWARLLPWLPYLATLALFVAGLWSLYHLLRDVSLREVETQIRAVSAGHLAGAVAATAAGYAALVCYDWSALRYIGRRLPARSVALGGFLGYAVGNTVGLSALSGGAVRYRVYSALGLGLADIARISAFVAVASGVGATLIGMAALTAYPDALRAALPLPPALVQLVAGAGFVAANALIWWASLRGGVLHMGRMSLPAPRPGVLGAQMLITAFDMCMGALVLYLLLPHAGTIGYVPFLAVYLAAMMAGIISHVPGGVGVFETVVIAALPASVPVTDAAAALLLYRLIYYILPFVAALAILAGAEGRRLLTGRITGAALSLTTGLVPLAMGAMVMASGAVMMLAPMIPPSSHLADEIEAAMPFVLVETGALLSSAIGAALVLVAQGLLRRLAGAWWLTMVALLAGIGAALLDGWNTDRAAMLGLACLLLAPCRGEFYRSTRLTTGALSPSWLMLVGAMLSSVILVLFLATDAARPYAGDLWWQFPDDTRAPRALRVALTGGIVLALLTIWQALRHVPRHPPRGGARVDDHAHVGALLGRALAGGERFLLSEGGGAVIAYTPRGRVWLVRGDPFGDPAQIPGLIWAFRDAARRARVVPVFDGAGARWFPQWIETGMAVHRLGEAAILDLTRLTPAPVPDDADNAADSDADVPPDWLTPDDPRHQLVAGAGWRDAFGGGLQGCGQGPYRLAGFGRDGRLQGVASVHFDPVGGAAALGALRLAAGVPEARAGAFLAQLAQALAGQGMQRLDLGMVPGDAARDALPGRSLPPPEALAEARARARRVLGTLAPDWQPRYLVLPRLANPAAVMADLA